MRQLTLTEYQPCEGVQLTPAQVDALRTNLPDLRMTPTLGTPGHFDLVPASTVGTLVAEGLRVDITPKVRPASLLYMMSVPFNAKAWRGDLAGMDTAKHLVEALLPTFLRHTEQALSRGPLHRYATMEDRLPTIRGRLLFEQQLRSSPGIPLPVSVRFDDYTADIEENRVLRAAARRLRYLVSHPAHQQRLNRIDALLSEAASVSYAPAAIPAFTYDRLNGHYRDALQLASLVLQNTGLEHRLGSQPSVTFLADMNKVFEDFVVASLRRELGLSDRELDQNCRHHRVYLDSLPPSVGRIRLQPDISWWRRGECVFAGDVKYKRLSARGYQHADLYQLLAYLTALGLPDGLLIYPSSEANPQTFMVPMSGKRLRVYVLPVHGEPHEIEHEVAHLASTIKASGSQASRSQPSLTLETA